MVQCHYQGSVSNFQWALTHSELNLRVPVIGKFATFKKCIQVLIHSLILQRSMRPTALTAYRGQKVNGFQHAAHSAFGFERVRKGVFNEKNSTSRTIFNASLPHPIQSPPKLSCHDMFVCVCVQCVRINLSTLPLYSF